MMTDRERRMAWPGAQDAILQATWVEMPDWPDALTPAQIGALHARQADGTSNKAAMHELSEYLQGEIDGGRIASVLVDQQLAEIGIVLLGYDVPRNPSLSKVEAISGQDCARLLIGFKTSPYLDAWLAPYLQQGESDHAEEEPGGLTPMRRAVIIDRLGRRYPSLKSDFNRTEEWVKECATSKRGEYYLEKIEAGCLSKWGNGNVPAAAVASIRENKLRG